VSAVLLNRRISKNALTFRFTFAMNEQEEVLASIGEVEAKRLLLCDQCLEFDSLRFCGGHGTCR
jgi:hypothetical protein